MASSKLTAALCSALAMGIAPAAFADNQPEDHYWWSHHEKWSPTFERIATLPNYRNNENRADETVSEIVAATQDGMTLVYTDGTLEAIGFIDITNPHEPEPAGTVPLSGEPTSVSVLGNDYALVGVNTSASFVQPSGVLAVVDVKTRQVVAEIELGGQPDSLAISKDRKFAAVVIENERDEDIVVDGEEGGLPQLPAGFLAIVDLIGEPSAWIARNADLTGLSSYAPEDPEPEFVDINHLNQAVVTMQENNHIAVVDLYSGKVISDFDLGTVDLTDIDVTEEDIISLDGSLQDVQREPDAVTWIPAGKYHSLIATANEGDLFGGSRGFSIFKKDGTLVYDSGNEFEHIAVRNGHYPEGRSENKGSEPESIEFGRYGYKDFLFVGSERGSFVAVYQLNYFKQPEFVQILPAPLGPEGLLAIPSRNLLVVSGEEDLGELAVRSSVMIYELGYGEPTYPQIHSANDDFGRPIAWSALSGMVATGNGKELLAVWDSFYAQSAIVTIDASKAPALITKTLPITGGTGNYDPEGIDIAPDGTYWIASEGNASGARPNRLLQVDASGAVVREVGLPAEIEACRAASANTGSLGAGFEGVAVLERKSWSWWHWQEKDYVLLVAQQRGWDYTTAECEDLDDDPQGLNAGEPKQTRIWIYDPNDDSWDHIGYELAPKPAEAAWVGLSEITKVPGGYIILERDNRTGDFATLKTLVNFRSYAAKDGIVAASEKKVYDMLPDLLASNGWVSDKPEGVAVTKDGTVFVVTDNDGVDDWSGETWFLRLGSFWQLFW